MNRQEDLTKVFDKTWQANHNDVAKRGREKEKEFMSRMFKTSNRPLNKVEKVPPDMQAKQLQNNINNASAFNRQVKVNNIVSKWK